MSATPAGFFDVEQTGWIDSQTGFRFLVGRTYPSFKWFAKERLIDLVGPRIGQVLDHVRWRPALPSGVRCAMLVDGEEPVAVGWSTPAITTGGQFGFNGSYLVSPHHEGRGHASLCAAAAFAAAYGSAERKIGPEALSDARAWLQTQLGNVRSVSLARRQGFVADPALSFSCVVSVNDNAREALDYVGLSQPVSSYLEVASKLFMDRLDAVDTAVKADFCSMPSRG